MVTSHALWYAVPSSLVLRLCPFLTYHTHKYMYDNTCGKERKGEGEPENDATLWLLNYCAFEFTPDRA